MIGGRRRSGRAVQARGQPPTTIVDTEHWALAGLAKKINESTLAAEHHARSALTFALVAGESLNTAKGHVKHGDWAPWLTANCSHLAHRTARAYMAFATRWEQLSEPERHAVADLPLREAIKAIATDAVAPQRHTDPVTRITKTEADQAATAMRKGVKVMNAIARKIEMIQESKASERVCMRKKLDAAYQAAIGALDKMGGTSKPEALDQA